MADVFISYAQRAPEPTHALASELIQHGIDAWFDVNLLPGDAFGKVLDSEIDRAKAVEGRRQLLGVHIGGARADELAVVQGALRFRRNPDRGQRRARPDRDGRDRRSRICSLPIRPVSTAA